MKIESDIGAIVIGFDRYMNYNKLAKAHRYLQRKECLFVATNTDASFPIDGQLFPGTGAFVSALATCSGRKPTIVGKPEALLLDLMVDEFGLDRARTVMVGDRLDTDILFGHGGGLKTLLVMTGVTTPKDRDSSNIKPDNWIESLANLK
jgi:4-nitrophenyl phosphatase